MARQSQTTVADAATLIGPGIFVRGRVSGEEDLHIEGRLEGSIDLTETVFVAPEGIVVATVRARDIVVSGVVIGNVTAEDSVTLNAGAKLVGDITAPRVIVSDGASFSGNVAMGGEPPPPRKVRRTAAAPRSTPVSSGSSVGKSAAQASSQASSKPEPRKAPPKPARPASKGSSKKSSSKAATRVAAIPTPRAARREDEQTVVIKHAEVEGAAQKKAGKKSTKKAPPRARVPKPGKRRVGRR